MTDRIAPSWRALVAGAILAVQILAIGYARFVPTRFLCWAPYDEIVFYQIEVDLPAGPLTAQQAHDRYRISKWGRSNRSWAHVTEAVAHYETTHGREDAAKAQIRYTVNGRGPFAWSWPEHHPHEPGIAHSASD